MRERLRRLWRRIFTHQPDVAGMKRAEIDLAVIRQRVRALETVRGKRNG